MRNRRRHLMEGGKVQGGLVQAYRAAAGRVLALRKGRGSARGGQGNLVAEELRSEGGVQVRLPARSVLVVESGALCRG